MIKQKIFTFFRKFLEKTHINRYHVFKIYVISNRIYFILKNFSKIRTRENNEFDKAVVFSHFKEDNYDNYRNIVSNLKRNLDKESITIVDKFLYNVEICYRSPIFTDFNINKQYIKEYKKMLADFKFVDFDVLQETFIYNNGLKFLTGEVLEYIKGRDMLDCGAYVGDSAYVFSKYYDFNKIYSFEPGTKTFLEMAENIKKYSLSNVEPVKIGVSNENSIKKITTLSNGSDVINDNSGEDIEVMRIDNFVVKNNVNVGVIKMDIEGAEYSAIEGAKETIKNQLPVLLISIYHTPKDFFMIKSYIEEISNNQYNFMIRKLNNFDFLSEIMLICYKK